MTSATSMTSRLMTEAEKDREFEAVLDSERGCLIKTMPVYWRGRYARVVFTGVSLPKKLVNKIRYVAGRRYHCRECMNRSERLANYIDANGERCWFRNVNHGDEGEISKLIRTAMKPDVTGVHVVTTKSVHGYSETSGHDADGTPFPHYTKQHDQVSDLTPEEAEVCQYVMNKYIPLIFCLLNRFPNITGMRDSTKMMIEVAKEATYGIKVLSSLNWMLDVLEHIIENYDGRSVSPQMSHLDRTRIAVYAISRANVSKDYNGWVLTQYHQVNGTLLNVFLNAISKEGIKRMLENIFDPKSYKKPTSEPTEKEILLAEKLIGDCKMSIFSIDEEYERLDGVYTVGCNKSPEEKKGIWANLREERKRLQKGSGLDDKYNCASRFADGIENFSTVTELIRRIKNCEFDKITISFKVEFSNTTNGGLTWNQDYSNNGNLESACFCKVTGMKTDVLKTPYIWNFEGKNYYQDMILEVSHVHISDTSTFHNVVFILKTQCGKSSYSKKVFHAAFLSPEYERILRKPWAALQDTAKDIVTMPEGYVAAGVGSSKGQYNGKLTSPVALTLRKGDLSRDVVITHW